MKITLTYFDMAASRGEECRLALHHAALPFTDERLTRAEWLARRASTPFGALPVLTVEGHEPIGQSNSILRLIGRLHDLHPADPWQAAREESLMEAVEDLRARLSPLRRLSDENEKRQARQELAAGYMQEWGASIEKHLGSGPFVGGEVLHVADLKLYVVMHPFISGNIDHIPGDVFKAFPRLLRLYAAVKEHPRTRSWYAR
jgi:glutathione S-transferase